MLHFKVFSTPSIPLRNFTLRESGQILPAIQMVGHSMPYYLRFTRWLLAFYYSIVLRCCHYTGTFEFPSLSDCKKLDFISLS
jgi:hypothetical protein